MRNACLEINAWFIILYAPTFMHKHTLVNVHKLEHGFIKIKETDAAFNIVLPLMNSKLDALFVQSNSNK